MMIISTLALALAAATPVAGVDSVQSWLDQQQSCAHEHAGQAKVAHDHGAPPSAPALAAYLGRGPVLLTDASRALRALAHDARRGVDPATLTLLRRIAEGQQTVKLAVDTGSPEDDAQFRVWAGQRLRKDAADALLSYHAETAEVRHAWASGKDALIAERAQRTIARGARK